MKIETFTLRSNDTGVWLRYGRYIRIVADRISLPGFPG